MDNTAHFFAVNIKLSWFWVSLVFLPLCVERLSWCVMLLFYTSSLCLFPTFYSLHLSVFNSFFILKPLLVIRHFHICSPALLCVLLLTAAFFLLSWNVVLLLLLTSCFCCLPLFNGLCINITFYFQLALCLACGCSWKQHKSMTKAIASSWLVCFA